MQSKPLESQILVDEESVRVSLLRFAAGHELGEHSSPKPIAIQVLHGRGELVAAAERRRLERGAYLTLPAAEPHSVRAETDLMFLLTVHKAGAPVAPPRAKPPKHPLELLLESHRRSEQFLKVVQLLAQQPGGNFLEKHEQSALELALAFFAETRPLHQRDEEDSLFPRLQGSYLAPRLRKLENEHGLLDQLHGDMQSHMRRWIEKARLEPEDRRALEVTLAAIADLHKRHRAFEEQEVFPFAKQTFAAEDWDAMTQEFDARRK
jgi:quercetin dioxygenase-like cupin family protein/hemerythrin-like domain-containing protein